MRREQLVHLALRIGAAFAFLYPSIAAVFDPVSWFSYFPRFVRDLPVDPLVLLHGFGILEAALALWVLSGWKIRTPAFAMTAILIAIVVLNLSGLDVVFRDLSIALMTLALALWPKTRPSPSASALLVQPSSPREHQEGQG